MDSTIQMKYMYTKDRTGLNLTKWCKYGKRPKEQPLLHPTQCTRGTEGVWRIIAKPAKGNWGEKQNIFILVTKLHNAESIVLNLVTS